MSYIGRGLQSGAFRQLDDISSGFDGSDTTHTMQVNSTNVTVGDVNQILLSLGGVIQKPGTDFTVSASVLTFTTAPAANTSFFAILLGSDNGGTVTPTDGSVTTAKIVDANVTKAKLADSVDIFAGTSLSAADLGSGIHIKTADSGASVSSTSDELVVEGSSVGMSFLDATGGATRIAFGDSGDNDIGKIIYAHSDNSMAFVTNTAEALRISSAGEVTKPLQPAFHVEPASQQSDLASGAQIVWGTENFDIGSNFASNTFTAPITGKYFIGHSIRLQNLDTAANYYFIQITGSNRGHYHIFDPNLSEDSLYQEFTNAVLLDMDANDTVDIAFGQNGGAQQTDVSTASYFYGYLLG